MVILEVEKCYNELASKKYLGKYVKTDMRSAEGHGYSERIHEFEKGSISTPLNNENITETETANGKIYITYASDKVEHTVCIELAKPTKKRGWLWGGRRTSSIKSRKGRKGRRTRRKN
jgi:hypothetical protein